MEFVQQLQQLTQQADDFIRKQVEEMGTVTFFNPAETDKVNIDDDYPEFPHYDKYDYVEFAAIAEIKQMDWGGIEITGILKGESFPQIITVTLGDLPYEQLIFLADFLINHIQNNS